MTKSEINSLLSQAKYTVNNAIKILRSHSAESLRHYSYSQENEREMKAKVDIVMNQAIFDRLSGTGVSILSEESYFYEKNINSAYKFIVDPLDGTVNFVRGTGPFAISIALYKDNTPVFGVIGDVLSQNLFWGGRGIGSFVGGKKMSVSSIKTLNESILCTGFPSRFDFNNEQKTSDYCKFMSQFGKVRMIGSASISLTHVAHGDAECYSENNIMIWDVAAGLAIVEGSGGKVDITTGDFHNSLNVIATNGVLSVQKGYTA